MREISWKCREVCKRGERGFSPVAAPRVAKADFAYQSLPRTLPSFGMWAFLQVVKVMLEEIVLVEPSPRPTTMTPSVWPLCNRPTRQLSAVGCDWKGIVDEPRSGNPCWGQWPMGGGGFGAGDAGAGGRGTQSPPAAPRFFAVTLPYTGESNGSPLGNAVVLPHAAAAKKVGSAPPSLHN